MARIGESAFEGCTSLASITLGDSVTFIGGCAFEGCISLKSITIPESLRDIVTRVLQRLSVSITCQSPFPREKAGNDHASSSCVRDRVCRSVLMPLAQRLVQLAGKCFLFCVPVVL